MVLSSLLFLAACDPHDAEITGDYAMYLSEATSDNLERLRLDYSPPACEFDQSDPRIDEADIKYAEIFTDACYQERVALEKQFQEDWDLTPVDCRDLSELNAIELRDSILPGFEEEYEKQCCIESWDDEKGNYDAENSFTDNDPDGVLFPLDDDGNLQNNNDCTLMEPKYNTWLNDYAFYLNRGKLETWREEVLLTTEGDLLFTAHTQTPFGDFRFFWVIDPKFQPIECVDVDGVSTLRPLDGDWVEGWSNTEPDDEGYTVYMVNAYGYQVSPANGDYWYFNKDWSAAYTGGKFGDEDLFGNGVNYTDYNQGAEVEVPFWVATNDAGEVEGGYGTYPDAQYEELDCGENFNADDECTNFTDYADFRQMVVDNMTNGGTDRSGDIVPPVETEFERLGRLPHDEFPWRVKVEDNSWRPTPEGQGSEATKFDNWVALAPVHIRFKTDRDTLAGLEPGSLDTPIEGDFQLMSASANSSNSQMLIRGEFTITNIERDIWGYSPTLDAQKREENETPVCGE